jgi:transposase
MDSQAPPKCSCAAGWVAARVNPSPVFVLLQIETAKAPRAAVAMSKLHVRLPTGVETDLSEARLEELPTVIRILSELSCSISSSR